MFIALQAAQGGAAKGAGSYSFIIMMVLIFVVMWLLMIRPQQKRQKEMNKFRDSLQKGQKVITAGGIYGTIREIDDTAVLIEVDANVKIRIAKSMIMKDPTDLEQK